MASEDPVSRLASLLSTYASIAANYHATPLNTTRDERDVEHQVDDSWHALHYLAVGNEAIQLILRQLIANERTPPTTILDLACGSGRVTRHLRAAFPEARIACCDLYPEHLAFCAEQFDVETILSSENPDDVEVGAEWDLVFCGSLLTHLPEKWFAPALRLATRALSTTGIALITLEGRRAIEIQDTSWKMIDDARFEVARKAYLRTGYGFVGYHDEMRRFFKRQAEYGVTLVKPSKVLSVVEQMPDVRILAYLERAWDDHQDLLVFGRPGAIGA